MLPLSLNKKAELKNRIKDIDYEEFKNAALKGYTRADRRNAERELKKLEHTVNNMNGPQLKMVDAITNEKVNERMEKFYYSLDRAITGFFVVNYEEYDFDKIRDLEIQLGEMIQEDLYKEEKILKEFKGDYKMVKKAIEKIEGQIKDRVYELLNKGVGQKQIIDDLVIEFPKLSKSMVSNTVKKYKELWKEEQAVKEVSEEEKVINEKLEYIFEEEPAKKTAKTLKEAQEEIVAKEVLVTEETKQVVKETVKEEVKNEVEEVKMNSLKVKSMVLELEGANGEYKASKEGVVLVRSNAQIDFKNLEELEKWTSEVKEVFKMVGGVA